MINRKDDDLELQERLVSLTRDLIIIPSNRFREEDRQRCFEFIKNHLESLEHIEVRQFEENGIPSLVAAPPGCHKPEILMCGHLDVIAHPEVSSYTSRLEDNRIYGPGAGDMKGALAIMMEVFRNIHMKKPTASLGIAVTSDEEMGGESGVGYLFNKMGLSCSLAMIPDGGSLNSITIEEKGILHMKVTADGQSSHAARPWLGDNPIERLMDKLTDLRRYFDTLKKEGTHWYPTCAISIIGTENQTTNRIPTEAHAILDIRFPPPLTVEQLFEKIREVLGGEIRPEIILSANPIHLSPDDQYQKITEDVTGKPANLVQDDGGSDARYIAPLGVPVMMSRPLVGNLHSVDEWIDIASMVSFYKIYEKYLLKKLK